MNYFDPKKKAIVWILISVVFFFLILSSDDNFFKGDLFEILVALFGVCLISGFVGFIVLFFINAILSMFSPTKKDDITVSKITVSEEDRKKFKNEIDQIFLKLKKKLTDLSKAFKIGQEYSDKEIREIISIKLKGTNDPKPMSPDFSGGYHFKFKEFKDFSFSISFKSSFNYGCYGHKKYHGISFEYFSKLKIYRLKLDTDAENAEEENSVKKQLSPEAVKIIQETVNPNSFK